MAVSIRSSILKSLIISTTIAPPGPTYSRYGFFEARNGYAGEGGINGFLSLTSPFVSTFSVLDPEADLQTLPDTATSYSLLTTTGIFDSDLGLTTSLGSGLVAAAPGSVTPMAVLSTRVGTQTSGSANNFARLFYFPMVTGDSIWITGTTFTNEFDNNPFTISVTIGPNSSNGERYTCSGNSILDGFPGTITIDRLTDIGSR